MREQEKLYESSSGDESNIILSKDEQKMLRGYKTTSDGRTTSYFNREISEQEKKLIGNITPQRLMQPETPTDAPFPSGTTQSESAWNSAQTWEERDTTEWCTVTLKKRLTDTTALSNLYASSITNVDIVSGDASFALSSGRKRYIFDYTVELKFSVTAEGEEEDVASGSLKLIDVCSGTVNNGDYEIEHRWSNAPKVAHGDAVLLFCKNDLIGAVKVSVLKFVDDFSAHY